METKPLETLCLVFGQLCRRRGPTGTSADTGWQTLALAQMNELVPQKLVYGLLRKPVLAVPKGVPCGDVSIIPFLWFLVSTSMFWGAQVACASP